MDKVHRAYEKLLHHFFVSYVTSQSLGLIYIFMHDHSMVCSQMWQPLFHCTTRKLSFERLKCQSFHSYWTSCEEGV